MAHAGQTVLLSQYPDYWGNELLKYAESLPLSDLIRSGIDEIKKTDELLRRFKWGLKQIWAAKFPESVFKDENSDLGGEEAEPAPF